MCRIAAYFGLKEVLLEELLAKPKHSLIRQSHNAKEGTHGINADGFGLSWYNPEISSTPGIFKSIQPAWNDKNLIHLSEKIKSSAFLAHVRASTVGDVSQSNCHPFSFGDYSMVHNGNLKGFDDYKRDLLNVLEPDLFLNIKGNTDSEHLFHLVMHFVRQTGDLQAAVKQSIKWITKAQKNPQDLSLINIVITNGVELVATRFSSIKNESLSLRYFPSSCKTDGMNSVILSSEALCDNPTTWKELHENQYLYLNRKQMQIKVGSL